MAIAARWIGIGIVLALLVACGRIGGAGTGEAPSASASVAAATVPAATAAPATTSAPTAVPTATPSPALIAPSAPATATLATAAVSPTPGGAWIALAPDDGPPGTVVRMHGHVPGGPSAAGAASDEGERHGTVCWAGCLDGLSMEIGGIEWSTSTPGDFTLPFTVPAQPWLAANGPHALAPGDYAVGIQCLGPPVKGCLALPAQATATFHLRGPVPERCMPGQPCAQLRFTPAAAAPGDAVDVQGWAPLTAIIGAQPTGYGLVLLTPGEGEPAPLGQVRQALDGSLNGSFRLPVALPGQATLPPGRYTLALEAIHAAGTTPASTPVAGATITPLKAADAVRLTLAPTPFTVAAAPAWSTLGAITPVWVQHGGFDQPIQGDAQDPRRVAYCAPDGIHSTSDGGVTWTTIPTAGVAQAAAGGAYPLMHSASQSGGGPPTCVAVTLDPDHPASYYATFAAYHQAAPPIYYAGYATTDGGRSWQAVPVPGGDQGQFGGFQVNGRAVQALRSAPVRFSRPPDGSPPAPATPATAEQTDDGGRTWHAVPLGCPGAGPCLRAGPLPSGIGSCAMHGYLQPMLVSGDGGRTWGEAAWPGGSNACGASELASLSPTAAVLLAGDSPYPLLLTRDGGRTWQALALPAVPGGLDAAPSFSTLLMLPNGSLLAAPASAAGWYVLPTGGRAWCALPAAGLPTARTAVRVIGDRLWWLVASGPSDQAVVRGSVAVGSLRCGTGT